MQITRTLLVIFTPPLVAFLLPLVVSLSGPGVAWLRLATLVWALLASIIALDPGIADKLAQMRAIMSLWREASASPSAITPPPQKPPSQEISPGNDQEPRRPRPSLTSPRHEAYWRKRQKR